METPQKSDLLARQEYWQRHLVDSNKAVEVATEQLGQIATALSLMEEPHVEG